MTVMSGSAADLIVTADWTPGRAADLLADCDDTVDTGAVVEYWGTDDCEDDSAMTWRVHLLRADPDACDESDRSDEAVRS